MVNLNADNIVTGTLDASKATIINLDAEKHHHGKNYSGSDGNRDNYSSQWNHRGRSD